MITFKDALRQIKLNPSGFFYAALSVLILTMAISIINTGISWLLTGIASVIFGIISGIAGLIVNYVCLVSSLKLLDQTVIRGQKLSFSQFFSRFFEVIKENWKKPLKSYLIWNVLFELLLYLGAALILGGAAWLLLELGGFPGLGNLQRMYMMSEYISDFSMFEQVIVGIIPSMIGILFLIVIGTIIVNLFSCAIDFAGVYKVSADLQDKKLRRLPFGSCMIFAFIILAALIVYMSIVCVLAFIAIAEQSFLSLIPIFMIVVLSVFMTALIFIYRFFCYVKILMDVNDNLQSEPSFKEVPDLPNLNNTGSLPEQTDFAGNLSKSDSQKPDGPASGPGQPPVFSPENNPAERNAENQEMENRSTEAGKPDLPARPSAKKEIKKSSAIFNPYAANVQKNSEAEEACDDQKPGKEPGDHHRQDLVSDKDGIDKDKGHESNNQFFESSCQSNRQQTDIQEASERINADGNNIKANSQTAGIEIETETKE